MHAFLWGLAAVFSFFAWSLWYCIALPQERYQAEVIRGGNMPSGDLRKERQLDSIGFIVCVVVAAASFYFAAR